MRNTLIVIVGPTAIGKTRLSIKMAEAFNTEIISADSRQFYKEMRIGTAVPSLQELERIPHHFIQHLSVETNYSVGDFERDALEKLEGLYRKNPIAIMVGGSGLFVKAVTEGLDKFPEVTDEIREELNRAFEEKGLIYLQDELRRVDPDYTEKVDMKNPRRLIRALEIYRSSGAPYSSFLHQKKTRRPFDVIKIGLTASRESIYRRIEERVDRMMESGLLSEVKALYSKRYKKPLQTIGYKELFKYIDGECSVDSAVTEIKKNTRRFAKRQITWFKKDLKIHWFDYKTPYGEILSFVRNEMED